MPFTVPIAVVLMQTSAASAPAARVVRLDDAVRAALAHQPAMLQARATTEASAGRADQSRAPVLPQVTGTASYQLLYGNAPRTASTTGAPAATGAGAGTSTFMSAGVTASQIVWDFGQSWDRWKAAQRTVDSFRESERTTELSVLFNVRRAFFLARAQKALVHVAEDTVANLQLHLRQIEGFVRVGTRPEIDLAQARSDLANGRVQLINAQNAYDVARVQLNQAMGTMADIEYEVADETLGPVDGESLTAAQLVDRAMRARPELLALERQRDSQERTVRSIRGAYGPTLSVQGGAFESGNALDNLGASWNVGAFLTWPIFQGGLTNGQMREALANLDVTRAQVEAQRLQIRLDIEQAVVTIRAAKASVEAANDALANARERLRLAEGRYQSGVGSVIELSDAQVAAANSAAQVVQTELNLATARAQLLAALGRR
jgi:outer membrane protein